MTRFQRTLCSAALLAGLGGGSVAWLYTQKLSQRQATYDREQNSKRLFRFLPEQVISGTLYTQSATISFVRTEHPQHPFRLTRPVDELAHTETIENLILQTVALKMEKTLTEAATDHDLTSWGLDPPRTRLKLILSDENHHELLIGPKNALVDQYPVTDGHRTHVGLAFGSFQEAFSRELNEFRSRQLIDIPLDSLATVTVSHRENTPFRWEKTSASPDWTLHWTPEISSADTTLLPPHSASLTQTGTHAKSVTSSASTAATQPRITEVTRSSLGPQDAPMPFPIGVSRKDLGSAARVETFIKTFTERAPITRFVTDTYSSTTTEDRYGLHNPTWTLTWTSSSGHTIRMFAGQPTPDSQQGLSPWFARKEHSSSVYELASFVAYEFEHPPRYYLDRKIMRFNPQEVTHLDVYLEGEGEHSLQRNSKDSSWAESEQHDLRLKTWRIDAIVRTFSTMDGDLILDDQAPPKKLKEWSLTPPMRRLAFRSKDELVGQIHIGKNWNDHYVICRIPNTSQVMLLATAKLRVVPPSFDILIDTQ
ncbi:MAG: DUF4340 domain-containing protein [Myxococcales bacterium]|nr:DUF4340 domain-containing protein [Myxococcales bacterium]